MSKGRAAIVKHRPGPPRAHVPASSFFLPDGRTLHYTGMVPIGDLSAGRWVTTDRMLVLATMDRTPHGMLLHISCSYQSKDPTWEEIKALKQVFFGNVDCAMILPKAEDYINVYNHCFHLWQLPVVWGIQ